jgi:hypothetical protein
VQVAARRGEVERRQEPQRARVRGRRVRDALGERREERRVHGRGAHARRRRSGGGGGRARLLALLRGRRRLLLEQPRAALAGARVEVLHRERTLLHRLTTESTASPTGQAWENSTPLDSPA